MKILDELFTAFEEKEPLNDKIFPAGIFRVLICPNCRNNRFRRSSSLNPACKGCGTIVNLDKDDLPYILQHGEIEEDMIVLDKDMKPVTPQKVKPQKKSTKAHLVSHIPTLQDM